MRSSHRCARPVPPRARPAAAAVLAAACLAACGGGRDRAGSDWSDRVSRLISAPPAETFEAADLRPEEPIFEVDLTAESERGRWRRTDGAAVAADEGGVPIPGHEEGAWLLGTVPGVSGCDVVVVDTSWIKTGRLELVAGPGGTPGAAGAAPVSAFGRELFGRPAATRFRFPLERRRGAPDEAAPTDAAPDEAAPDEAAPDEAAPDETVALRQVAGDGARAVRLHCLRRRADGATPDAGASGPWKVDLGGEIRFAVPALDSRPVVYRAAVPERGLLRFGYGVAEERGSAAGIEIEVAAGVDGAPAADALWRSGPVPPGVWLDAEVDLAGYAGREVDLELRVAGAPAAAGAPVTAFLANPAVVPAAPPGRRPPNVVLISIDTLRADHLDLYGYPRRTAPNLSAWARREAVVFEQVVAQAPWTLPSHVSMLTGLDAPTHGVNYHRPAPEELLLLPEILYGRGYRTFAVTGGAYLDPQFGLDQGFERYHYFRGQDHANELDRSLEVGLDWLRQAAGEPFFLFFHTYDVHEPYYAREPEYGSFTGGEEPSPPVVTRSLPIERESAFQSRRETVFLRDRDGPPPDQRLVTAMYDSGIAHMDRGLGRLLDALDELGIADDTIVVFTSDHGEALGEHGLAGHADLHDHTILVPLVVKLPGREAAGERIPHQVRSMDIVPTLLDLLRLPPLPHVSGLSLLPVVRGARALPGGDGVTYEAIGNHGISIRDGGGEKYVLVDAAFKPTATPAEQLFDLVSDPGELRPSTGESVEMRRLRRQAQRWLRDAATGLHVRLWNPGAEVLCGVLVSDLLRHNSVKTPEVDSPADWLGAGRVRLGLPAGEQTYLIVLGPETPEPSLRFEPGPCRPGLEPPPGGSRFEPLDLVLPLAELTTPRWWRLEAGRWQPAPGGAAGGADGVLSVAWVGPLFAAGEGEDAGSPDAELEERLRALGYL